MNKEPNNNCKRSVENDFISDIISLPIFENNLTRTIAFANLVARLEDDTNKQPHKQRTAELLSDVQEIDSNDNLIQLIKQVHDIISNLRDSDEAHVWNRNGKLSAKWTADLKALTTALEYASPDAFMPTSKPEPPNAYGYYANGVPLMKNLAALALIIDDTIEVENGWELYGFPNPVQNEADEDIEPYCISTTPHMKRANMTAEFERSYTAYLNTWECEEYLFAHIHEEAKKCLPC